MQLSNSLVPRSSASSGYLLRQYGGAAAAYSLQRLDTSSENVVRVRESVGDTEADFTAEEVSGGALREFALQNDADLIRFANQSAATDKRMYFDGVNKRVDVSGMGTAADYFGACTIQATVLVADPSYTGIAWSLGTSAYRVYTASGTWRINATDTGVSASFGIQTIAVDFDASGQGIELRIDGNTEWTGTAAAGTNGTTTFQVGTRSSSLGWLGLIYDFSLSGSAVKNFAFNGYGNTDADWEDQVGSNDGTVQGSPALFSGQGFDAFVTTWYDQSGNGRNATQATAASQPQIVADGVVVTDGNGNPSVDFDGGNNWLLTSTVSAITGSIDHAAFCVFDLQATNASFEAALSIGFGSVATAASSLLGKNGSNNSWFGGDDLVSPAGGALSVGSPTLLAKSHVSGTTTGYKDGSATSGAANTYDMGADNKFFAIGAYAAAGTNAINAKISEAIVYLSDQSSNRTAIEANIASRYGITI